MIKASLSYNLVPLVVIPQLRRVSKGIYFRPRQTALGESQPNPAALQQMIAGKLKLFPAGIVAANMLGLTTQIPKRREMATAASSIPAKMFGPDVMVHTRRPEAWNRLSQSEAALLDVLRNRADNSELSAEDTVQRLLRLLKEDHRLEHLMQAAKTEPPRVRALLGALGQQLGYAPDALRELKQSLNPMSRFNFGLFMHLKHARTWQAKECPNHATMSAS